MLAFGGRRYRASKLAGVADIPAIVRAASDDDYAAQVIENQQRANLSNSELATAVEQLSTDGHNNKQIGTICNLKDYQVAAFKQVCKFPDELRDRLDKADIRALYDLFRQWSKTPAEIIDALPNAETFITITEARRIIGSITGKPTGSIVLDRAPPALPPAPTRQPSEPLHRASPPPAAPQRSIETEWDARREAALPPVPAKIETPVFIVKVARVHPRLKRLPAVAPSSPSIQRVTAFPRAPSEKLARAAARHRWEAAYDDVRRRHAEGQSLRRINRETGLARATVRKYAFAESFPRNGMREPKPSMLDPYLGHLHARLDEGCENATRLWRELQDLGFGGTAKQVRRWLSERRAGSAGTTIRSSPTLADLRVAIPTPSPLASSKQLSWHLPAGTRRPRSRGCRSGRTRPAGYRGGQGR